MKQRLILGLTVLVLAACTQTPPTPTHTPLPAPTGVIVPLSAATIVPPATPTLSFEVAPLTGAWWIDFYYVFTEGEYIDEITFSMTVGFEVDGSGRFRGRGEVAVEAVAPGCVADVEDGSNFMVDLRGHIEARQIAEDAPPELFFVIELTPEDSMLVQEYTVMCPPDNEVKTVQSQLLWHALRLTGLQTMHLPAEAGTHTFPTRNITSPSQKQLNYKMDITVYLGR